MQRHEALQLVLPWFAALARDAKAAAKLELSAEAKAAIVSALAAALAALAPTDEVHGQVTMEYVCFNLAASISLDLSCLKLRCSQRSATVERKG